MLPGAGASLPSSLWLLPTLSSLRPVMLRSDFLLLLRAATNVYPKLPEKGMYGSLRGNEPVQRDLCRSDGFVSHGSSIRVSQGAQMTLRILLALCFFPWVLLGLILLYWATVDRMDR